MDTPYSPLPLHSKSVNTNPGSPVDYKKNGLTRGTERELPETSSQSKYSRTGLLGQISLAPSPFVHTFVHDLWMTPRLTCENGRSGGFVVREWVCQTRRAEALAPTRHNSFRLKKKDQIAHVQAVPCRKWLAVHLLQTLDVR